MAREKEEQEKKEREAKSRSLFRNLVYVKGPEEASDETSMAAVERLVASGEITAATLVWTEGMEAWTALGECKDMFEWPSGAPPL